MFGFFGFIHLDMLADFLNLCASRKSIINKNKENKNEAGNPALFDQNMNNNLDSFGMEVTKTQPKGSFQK